MLVSRFLDSIRMLMNMLFLGPSEINNNLLCNDLKVSSMAQKAGNYKRQSLEEELV